MWNKFTDGYGTVYIQLNGDSVEGYYDLICVFPGYKYKNRAGYCSFGLGLEDLNRDLGTDFTNLDADMEDIATEILDAGAYNDNIFTDWLTPLGMGSQDGRYGYNEFDVEQYEIGDKNLKYYLNIELRNN